MSAIIVSSIAVMFVGIFMISTPIEDNQFDKYLRLEGDVVVVWESWSFIVLEDELGNNESFYTKFYLGKMLSEQYELRDTVKF